MDKTKGNDGLSEQVRMLLWQNESANARDNSSITL